jgi:putative membrane protein
MQPKEHPRYDLALLIGFLLIVAALGISPRSRVDWILENLLALLLVLVLRSLVARELAPARLRSSRQNRRLRSI